MRRPLLVVENLSKFFFLQKSFFLREKIEIRAVDAVDLKIFPSKTLALVGESGCGKTTLAKLILKLIEPTSGRIRFADEVSNLRKDIQMVFQNPYNSLDPLMRVEALIEEPLLIHRIGSAKERKRKVKELLELVGIEPDKRFRLPYEFSGGERQRISLARALAPGPKIIILDEPISSLDVRIQAQILKVLKDLEIKFDLSFLFITHNLSVVKNFSDYCLVMYLGKIMERGPTKELFQSPSHPYTESLLLASKEKRSKLKGDIPRFYKISGCIFNTRCPYRKNKCFNIEPHLEEKRENRFAACHFPLNKRGAEDD